MDKEKKKRIMDDVNAVGVGLSGAMLGGAYLPEDFLEPALSKIAKSGSPVGNFIADNVVLGPVDGAILNAATSGIGAMAALGLLRGIKKASNERHARKLELARAKNSHTIKVDRS